MNHVIESKCCKLKKYCKLIDYNKKRQYNINAKIKIDRIPTISTCDRHWTALGIENFNF